MKHRFTTFLVLLSTITGALAQQTIFEPPLEMKIFSTALQDSVGIEIHVPKDIALSEGIQFPVIYVLDKQNDINYDYNIHTIDYMTMLSAIPSVIAVGIEFDFHQRGPWTNPNATGGKADDFVSFLTDELQPGLQEKYPVADYNLLIGHSRTAISALYALSARPDFFNGAIASSAARFDFDDAYQKEIFEQFLAEAPHFDKHFQIYFSSGKESFGDKHEESVSQLIEFLESQDLPDNVHWKAFQEEVGHFIIPGFTVNRSLLGIFRPYTEAINRCFEIIKDPTFSTQVPWPQYESEYQKASVKLGYKVQPDMLFYNSFASSYSNDYEGLFGNQRTLLVAEILERAVRSYPHDFMFQLWLAELYAEIGKAEQSRHHLEIGRKLVMESTQISEEERQMYLEELD